MENSFVLCAKYVQFRNTGTFFPCACMECPEREDKKTIREPNQGEVRRGERAAKESQADNIEMDAKLLHRERERAKR